MQRLLSIGLAGIALGALAGCGGTRTVTVTVTQTVKVAAPATLPACTGNDLHGTFRAIPGSPGAGGISYLLTLTNTSGSRCFVVGLPGLQLLDARGRALPTSVSPGRPGPAVKIVVAPGGSASAQARFSPDVPGPGEPVLARQCEPTAHSLRVTPTGGGTLTVAVSPPTPVCEHGSLRLDQWHRGAG